MLSEILMRRQAWSYTESSWCELASFLAYFLANPGSTTLLIDTFNWKTSGLPNFFLISSIASDLGYTGSGLRLDSGDLIGDSLLCREMMSEFDKKRGYNMTECSRIVASNDINMPFLTRLKEMQSKQTEPVHSIDFFGIGTNLVNPKLKAVGFVMKLVEVEGRPKLKFSEEIIKMNLPYRKRVFQINVGGAVVLARFGEELFEGFEKGKGTVMTFYEVDKEERKVIGKEVVVEKVVCLNGTSLGDYDFGNFWEGYKEHFGREIEQHGEKRAEEFELLYSAGIVENLKFSY